LNAAARGSSPFEGEVAGEARDSQVELPTGMDDGLSSYDQAPVCLPPFDFETAVQILAAGVSRQGGE
jgi:hypothetical protein